MNSLKLWIPLFFIAASTLFPDDIIPFKADRITAELAEGRKRTVLSGNAQFSSGSMVVRADTIELFGEDFIYAQCSGNVHVEDEEKGWALWADRLFYNRRDDITLIQGNAVMEDSKNEIVIKGGIIENREKDGIVLIQVGVRILKDDLTCRAQTARYFRNEDRLELTGMPVVYKNGDEFRARRIFVDLANEKVRMEGDVQAEVKVREETEEESVE
jgi:lipopolysaccharide export system protein LptA